MATELGQPRSERGAEVGPGPAGVELQLLHGAYRLTVQAEPRPDDLAFQRVEVLDQMGEGDLQGQEVVVALAVEVGELTGRVGIGPPVLRGPVRGHAVFLAPD